MTHSYIDVDPYADAFGDPSVLVGRRLRLVGRVLSVRRAGKELAFVVLGAPSWRLQCVFREGAVGVSSQDIIEVMGLLVESSARSGTAGYELAVENWNSLSQARSIPFGTDNMTAEIVARHLRLRNRHVDLRNPRIAAIFKIRSQVVRQIFDFFFKEGYTCVNTPRIVGGIGSGPVKTLRLDFFGRPAQLTLASVLYHGVLVSGDIGRMFEMGDVFNAESNHGSSSGSEFTVVEFAAAYLGREEMMKVVESLILSVINGVIEDCGPELSVLECDLSSLGDRFDVITYSDAVARLGAGGLNYTWGQGHEFSGDAGRFLQTKFPAFFWITDHPASGKYFFSQQRESSFSPPVAVDFQLWHRNLGNLAEGSQRETRLGRLREQLETRGLAQSDFAHYLAAMEHGCPPFTGGGLGLDRFVMLLLGLPNFCEAVLFPRYPKHLDP